LIGKRIRSEFEHEAEQSYFEQSDEEENPSTPPLLDDDEEDNFKARPTSTEKDDEKDLPAPRWKKQKLDIKSISFHKNTVADQSSSLT
jgi:hypothetical protein